MWPGAAQGPAPVQAALLVERLLGRDRQHAEVGQPVGEHAHRGPVEVAVGRARASSAASAASLALRHSSYRSRCSGVKRPEIGSTRVMSAV